ncbi:MAG: phosphoribosylanthranilate isomerase [Gammaproteobacteria bacterium]
MRTRVKICGITRQEDGLTAASLGADALGFVFYDKSPRYVTAAVAETIVSRLPAFICKVGLFVDAPEAQVEAVLSTLRLDLLQFHGDESPDYCRQFGVPYIKAVRMRADVDVTALAQQHEQAAGLLLDSYQAGVAGGTGQVFDWRAVPKALPLPLILAGGLNAANVAAAIQQVQPYAVDVSGGVEATQGIKDAAKLADFMNEVKRVAN